MYKLSVKYNNFSVVIFTNEIKIDEWHIYFKMSVDGFKDLAENIRSRLSTTERHDLISNYKQKDNEVEVVMRKIYVKYEEHETMPITDFSSTTAKYLNKKQENSIILLL